MTDAPAPDPYATAKANLRDTIKWLATSLAAVGAAVIAGATINGLAALKGNALIGAAVLGAIGLLAILVAIAVMVRLLTSNIFYFSDLTSGNEIAKQINDHASDILSPQTETIADLVKARKDAVAAMKAATSPTDTAYASAYLTYSGANASIARVTNLAQFLKLREDFRNRELILFLLTVLIIMALGGYSLLVGGKSTLSDELAQKVLFKPGANWTDAASALARTCGGDPLNGTMSAKKSFDGWVTVKLAEAGKCGGLEVSLPASLVEMVGPSP